MQNLRTKGFIPPRAGYAGRSELYMRHLLTMSFLDRSEVETKRLTIEFLARSATSARGLKCYRNEASRNATGTLHNADTCANVELRGSPLLDCPARMQG